jgi:diaminopropionate ammonia-lyase
MTFFNTAMTESDPLTHPYGRETAQVLRVLFAGAPDFSITPLVKLDGPARALGLGELWAKDERNRWGQGSFKCLGGAYAVVSLAADALSREEGRAITPTDIFAGRAPKARGLIVATATAGNHGRAVAFGAKLVGARAVIFVYGDVPGPHIEAIEALGADVINVQGDYEAACRAAAEACEKNGWIMVSDVASEGYTQIPQRIMQGYSVLAAEALEQMGEAPSHVVLQAGVGGLAAAASSYFANTLSLKPVTVVAEAVSVPCLMESARAGRMTRTPSTGPTNLNRLDCPTPSTIAWPVLRALADVFVAVDNDTASEAADMLKREGLATTPTGAAGLAALLALSQERGAFQKLGLGAKSRVLIVITERANA